MTHDTLVIGGGPLGVELAAELATAVEDVAVLDEPAGAARARLAGLTVYESLLESAAPPVETAAGTVVVATPSDARNLLLSTAARRTFDAERVVALVNDPERRHAFEAAGIETVCVAAALAQATTDALDGDATDQSPPDTDAPDESPPDTDASGPADGAETPDRPETPDGPVGVG